MLSQRISHALLIPIILLAACTSKGPDDRRGSRDDSRGSDSDRSRSDAGAVDTASAKPAANLFRVLPFERGSLPKELIYQGQLLAGAHWSDANGDNTLLVSQKISRSEESQKQELFGYLYVVKDGRTKLLWKIQDAADNWCDLGEGLVSDIVVLDLDGDEVAENSFVYNVQGSCDVSPRPFKLMLHSGERKYAVRGTDHVKAPDPMGGEKSFDPAFDKAPKAFREYAAEMWAKYVR